MKMKKVIVNGRFLLHRVTGVERYAREILSELDKLVSPGEIEIAVPPEVERIPHYENISVSKTGRFHNRAWEHISFPFYVRKKKGVSLNLCNVAPLSNPGLAGIMDMKIHAHPEFYSKKFLMWYRLLFFNAIKRARKIITISEFSKEEILKYYRVKGEKIVVVPCAWQHIERTEYSENALDKYGLSKGTYYYSMCSLEPNKNFRWIAEAAKKNSNDVFAVAGSINREVFSNGLGFDCPENMKLLGYVSDEEAKTLMRDCKAFLFPSFYEGFGMPPLEALGAGAPYVVVSDTPVMHEVFDAAAVYLNPSDYEHIELQQNHPEESNRKVVLSKYSWKKSAEIIKQIIDSLK